MKNNQFLDNTYRPIFIREMSSIINNFPKKNVLGPDELTGESYQTFKKKIITIL